MWPTNAGDAPVFEPASQSGLLHKTKEREQDLGNLLGWLVPNTEVQGRRTSSRPQSIGHAFTCQQTPVGHPPLAQPCSNGGDTTAVNENGPCSQGADILVHHNPDDHMMCAMSDGTKCQGE